MDSCCLDSNRSWFALRVKSNFEKPTALALHNRGIEDYLPVYRSRRVYEHCSRQVEKPVFPGYVFGRFDVNDRLPVLTIPGVVHIVGVGKMPVPVDSGELAAVRRILDSRLPSEPWPFLNVGQRIVIEKGPLRGLEGIVLQVRKYYRLVVSVTLLQRSIAAEIDHDWVRSAPRTVWVPRTAPALYAES